MRVCIHSRVYNGTTLYIVKHLYGLNIKLLTRPSKKNIIISHLLTSPCKDYLMVANVHPKLLIGPITNYIMEYACTLGYCWDLVTTP